MHNGQATRKEVNSLMQLLELKSAATTDDGRVRQRQGVSRKAFCCLRWRVQRRCHKVGLAQRATLSASLILSSVVRSCARSKRCCPLWSYVSWKVPAILPDSLHALSSMHCCSSSIDIAGLQWLAMLCAGNACADCWQKLQGCGSGAQFTVGWRHQIDGSGRSIAIWQDVLEVGDLADNVPDRM